MARVTIHIRAHGPVSEDSGEAIQYAASELRDALVSAGLDPKAFIDVQADKAEPVAPEPSVASTPVPAPEPPTK
jgi:hypothetical protein